MPFRSANHPNSNGIRKLSGSGGGGIRSEAVAPHVIGPADGLGVPAAIKTHHHHHHLHGQSHRPKCCNARLKSHLLEWFLTVVVIVIPLACAVLLIPFRNRAISLLDSSIQQPYHPTDSLPILGVFIPSIVVPLTFFFAYPMILSKYAHRMGLPEHPYSFHYTYWWSSCIVQAVGLTVLLSELSKRLVQAPRPDFMHRCFPDGIPAAIMEAGRSTNFIVNTGLCTPVTAAVYEDGLQSLPSEHTSLSCCMMTVLILFFYTLRRELVAHAQRLSRASRVERRSALVRRLIAAGVSVEHAQTMAAAVAPGSGGGRCKHTTGLGPGQIDLGAGAVSVSPRHPLAKRDDEEEGGSPRMLPPTLLGDPLQSLDVPEGPLDVPLDDCVAEASPPPLHRTDGGPYAADDEAPGVDGMVGAVDAGLPPGILRDDEAGSSHAMAQRERTRQSRASEGLTIRPNAAPAGASAAAAAVAAEHGVGAAPSSAAPASQPAAAGAGAGGHDASSSLSNPESDAASRVQMAYWPNSHVVFIAHVLFPFGWAVSVGLSRTFDHKHSFSDVVVGAVLGIGVAFAVFRMHLIKFQGYHRRWNEKQECEEMDLEAARSELEARQLAWARHHSSASPMPMPSMSRAPSYSFGYAPYNYPMVYSSHSGTSAAPTTNGTVEPLPRGLSHLQVPSSSHHHPRPQLRHFGSSNAPPPAPIQLDGMWTKEEQEDQDVGIINGDGPAAADVPDAASGSSGSTIVPPPRSTVLSPMLPLPQLRNRPSSEPASSNNNRAPVVVRPASSSVQQQQQQQQPNQVHSPAQMA